MIKIGIIKNKNMIFQYMVVPKIKIKIMNNLIKCYILDMLNIKQIKYYFINKRDLIEKDLNH